MKTGLVLEGGAMRGIYTAGVLDVLDKNKIHFDGVNRCFRRSSSWMFFCIRTERQKSSLFQKISE